MALVGKVSSFPFPPTLRRSNLKLTFTRTTCISLLVLLGYGIVLTLPLRAMKTAFSNPEYAKKIALLQAQALQVNPPSIWFERPTKKSKKGKDESDDEDLDEGKIKKMSIKIDPDDPDSGLMEIKCPVFEEGSAEEWIKWRIQLEEVIRDTPLNTGHHPCNAPFHFLCPWSVYDPN